MGLGELRDGHVHHRGMHHNHRSRGRFGRHRRGHDRSHRLCGGSDRWPGGGIGTELRGVGERQRAIRPDFPERAAERCGALCERRANERVRAVGGLGEADAEPDRGGAAPTPVGGDIVHRSRASGHVQQRRVGRGRGVRALRRECGSADPPRGRSGGVPHPAVDGQCGGHGRERTLPSRHSGERGHHNGEAGFRQSRIRRAGARQISAGMVRRHVQDSEPGGAKGCLHWVRACGAGQPPQHTKHGIRDGRGHHVDTVRGRFVAHTLVGYCAKFALGAI
mmetsp:Transcript_19098/g.40019  ORF Transcript_19098/g.40019 Transcript_19098/m.40019 type:complete len:278 (-) Transcript_19098:1908-2741(-)